MTQRASNLVGGICGLAAVALLVGSFPFTGATPEPGASADKVAEYLDRSSALTWTGIDLELFGIALLIVFAGRDMAPAHDRPRALPCADCSCPQIAATREANRWQDQRFARTQS